MLAAGTARHPNRSTVCRHLSLTTRQGDQRGPADRGGRTHLSEPARPRAVDEQVNGSLQPDYAPPMGRASRAKMERRQDPSHQAKRRAARADRRGIQVGRDAAAHVDAVRRRGSDGLAEALIARHNLRMLNLESTAQQLSSTALAALTPLFAMDQAMWDLGLRGGRHPCDYGRTWLAHLVWATDSSAIAARYLLCGQVVAASIVARSQLERWTQNVAANDELPKQAGESTADWIDRLMSSAANSERIVLRPSSRLSSETTSPSPAVPVSGVENERLGQDFVDMSELVHGRGPLLPYLYWEAQDLLDPQRKPNEPTLERLLRPLRIALRRVRVGLATIASDRGFSRLADRLECMADVQDDGLVMQNVQPMLFPLEPMALGSTGIEAATRALAQRYRARLQRRHVDDTPDEILPALAFGERRHRAMHYAREALAKEAELLGDEFDVEKITETMTEMVLAAECSASLATWVEGEYPTVVPDAFVTASSALRSMVWMWLEDDDRAMAADERF